MALAGAEAPGSESEVPGPGVGVGMAAVVDLPPQPAQVKTPAQVSNRSKQIF